MCKMGRNMCLRIVCTISMVFIISGVVECQTQRPPAPKHICGPNDDDCVHRSSDGKCNNQQHSSSGFQAISSRPSSVPISRQRLSPRAHVRHHHGAPKPHDSKIHNRGQRLRGRAMNLTAKPRKFFRPHIAQSSRLNPTRAQHQIPRIGYRTFPRRVAQVSTRSQTRNSKSSSKWKEYFKTRSRPTIRRVYDKAGRVTVIEQPKEMAPEKVVRNIDTSKYKLSNENKNKSPSTASPERIKTTTTTSWIVSNEDPVAPQADQPLTDLDLSESDEVVLTDLIVDLPESNSTNQVLSNFSTSVEYLGSVCRGDLCLQRQRLLNHSSSYGNNKLDPSAVACPTGYFKAYRGDTVICEAYRKSTEKKSKRNRNKKRKKNKDRKNKKKKKTTSSPIDITTTPSVETTTFITITGKRDVGGYICPPGQIKSTRGDLVLCIDDPTKKQTTDAHSKKCPPGQKVVRKDDETLCEVDGTITITSTNIDEVCPRGQTSVRRNNAVFCEAEGTVEVENTVDVQPDADGDQKSSCPRGKVPIVTSGGFICATSPGTDSNTSVETGTTAIACPDGTSPTVVDEKLVCGDDAELEVVLPRNGTCPEGYIITTLNDRSVCNRTDFAESQNGQCSEGFTLVTINDRPICQKVGAQPRIDDDFVNPTNEECPKGYILVASNGKSTCKRSYDITEVETDIIETIKGVCPLSYSLRTINGKYMCKKKNDIEPVDTMDMELPTNGKCPQGSSLITYHRKLVCKKDSDTGKEGTDILKPENGRCPVGYSMSTVNQRLVCVKDKTETKEEIARGNKETDFVQPTDKGCPDGYILTTNNGVETCRKLTLGIDYLLPENGACPDGSSLASIAGRLICKKISGYLKPKTCPKGQRIVKENGKAVCKPSTNQDPEPDLNCPPGYRTHRGICEDEKLIKILMESENKVYCPEGQLLVERNNMFYCEDRQTTPEALTTPTVCPTGHRLVREDGGSKCMVITAPETVTEFTTGTTESVTLSTETLSLPIKTTPSTNTAFQPKAKCPPGEKATIQDSKLVCVPARGDIDITDEIIETENTPTICPSGQLMVTNKGQTYCELSQTTLSSGGTHHQCPVGQRIVMEADKPFCELPGGVRVELYPEVVPMCPNGRTSVIRNRQSVCIGGGTPFCPNSGRLIINNGHQLCEKREGIVPNQEKVITRDPRRGPSETEAPMTVSDCPPGQSKILRDGRVFCEITGDMDINHRQITPSASATLVEKTTPKSPPTTSTDTRLRCPPGSTEITRNGRTICKTPTHHFIRLRLDINGLCPTGYNIITTESGQQECELTIVDIELSEDCPRGYTKVPLINGNFDCQTEEGSTTLTDQRLICPPGSTEITRHGKTLCKTPTHHFTRLRLDINGQCPTGYNIISTESGQQECELTIIDIELPEDCPRGYIKVPLINGNFDCQTEEGSRSTTLTEQRLRCPPGSTEIIRNERRVCKTVTHHFIRLRADINGQCPTGYNSITTESGQQECELTIIDIELPEDCPRGYIKVPLINGKFDCHIREGCPDGYTKIPRNDGNFDCEIDNTEDCPAGYKMFHLRNGQFECEIENTEDCPKGYKKIPLRHGKFECEIEKKEDCPKGYKKITLRNGQFECEIENTEDCPKGYKKIPLRHGKFECEIEKKEDCPKGYKKITLRNGQFDCEMDYTEDCPAGYKQIYLRNGQFDCEIDNTEDCQAGYKKIPLRNGQFDCEIENTEECPKGYKKIPLRHGKFECEIENTEECPKGYKKIPLRHGKFECEIENTEECPAGYKKIPLRNGQFDCEMDNTEDCPAGHKKIPLRNGQFDCEIENTEDCPAGHKKIPLRNGQFDCEIENTEDCPKGYKKITLRNGQFDCEIDNNEDCLAGYKKILLRNGQFDCEIENTEDCPNGYKKIALRNGQFDCEIDNTEDCPIGYRKVTRRDGSFDCEVAETRVACPRGFVRKWRLNRYQCEPISSGGTNNKDTGSDWVDPSLVDCPEGYVRSLQDGLLVCEALRGSVLAESNITCGRNELLFFTESGPNCEVFRCNKGEELVVVDGVKQCRIIVTTTPVPICPPEMDVVQTGSGYICRYKEVTTTTIRTTTITCPQGEIRVRTQSGIRCILIETEQPPTTVAPCVEGLVPLETASGIVCVFKQLSTTTTPAPTSCPPGMIIMETIEGGTVCGFESFGEITCERGQVDIYTLDGYIICKHIEDLLPEENPCPLGLNLVPTENGAECRYKESPVHETQDILSCLLSQILTFTEYVFLCADLIAEESPPICFKHEIVVQVNRRLQCVGKQFVSLVCEDGQRMVHTDSGFYCHVSEFDVTDQCSEGEIMLIFGTEKLCKKLEQNMDLCGEGYKARRTKDGFVCSSLHLPLECPPGYHLLSSGGKPECYPLDDDKPCLGLDGVPCDKGVKLVPCQPGYDVIDGKAGPECELGDFVEVVCNEGSQCVAESCKTGYGTRTCQDLLQLALDGCIPQCSNGGTCMNKTCYCPAGVAGDSCEEDIDECNELPEGYCQYGCHNTFGNFECRCPADATLNEDGRTCTAIGCIPDCMNDGVCVGGTCSCPRGFTGSVCQNDVDECAERNGMCEFHCRNTFGSFACICPPGSRLREDHRTCLNTTCIPECKNRGKCENHKCLCTTGYYGIICQLDVNECYNNHSCSHQCINTRGSYRCQCPDGWRLGPDRKACQNMGQATPTMLQDSWQSFQRDTLRAQRQGARRTTRPDVRQALRGESRRAARLNTRYTAREDARRLRRGQLHGELHALGQADLRELRRGHFRDSHVATPMDTRKAARILRRNQLHNEIRAKRQETRRVERQNTRRAERQNTRQTERRNARREDVRNTQRAERQNSRRASRQNKRRA